VLEMMLGEKLSWSGLTSLLNNIRNCPPVLQERLVRKAVEYEPWERPRLLEFQLLNALRSSPEGLKHLKSVLADTSERINHVCKEFLEKSHSAEPLDKVATAACDRALDECIRSGTQM
jgi:hypothetical protein